MGTQHAGAQHGVSVSDTNPETMMATAIDTANSRKTRPTMPPISRTGMNTAISENVIETMVKPISRAPFRPLRTAACRLDVPHDVLEHDDGVIDDEADRQRQCEQRHVVD